MILEFMKNDCWYMKINTIGIVIALGCMIFIQNNYTVELYTLRAKWENRLL